MELKFIYERATKNALRFQENSEEPKIGTLYLKKSAAAELEIKEGDGLTVTIIREEK